MNEKIDFDTPCQQMGAPDNNQGKGHKKSEKKKSLWRRIIEAIKYIFC